MTPPQHMEALAIGQQRRRHQWELRWSIQDSSPPVARRRAAAVLRSPHVDEAGMRAEDLLTAVPGIGSGTARRMLIAVDAPPADPRLRDLTPLRREALARELEGET